MTKHQKQQYEIRYEIEGEMNYRTGARAIHMAHRIADTKTNRQLYGNFIDHNFNLCPTENEWENSKCNIGFNPGKVKKLLYLIENRGEEILTCKYIDNYILDKIEREDDL